MLQGKVSVNTYLLGHLQVLERGWFNLINAPVLLSVYSFFISKLSEYALEGLQWRVLVS